MQLDLFNAKAAVNSAKLKTNALAKMMIIELNITLAVFITAINLSD